MASHAPLLVSPEEYLARERQAETKSEYVGGKIVAMTGASREHNLIAMNLSISIGGQLRGRPCEAYANDMRVRVYHRDRDYVYPDLVVVCGRPELEDEHFDTLLNPTVIIEVLSPSTRDYDHGAKWLMYQQLSTLSDYLLVSQDHPRVEHYVRQDEGSWIYQVSTEPDAVVRLESIGCELALREVYDKVFD